jgi:hypothetical protein
MTRMLSGDRSSNVLFDREIAIFTPPKSNDTFDAKSYESEIDKLRPNVVCLWGCLVTELVSPLNDVNDIASA